MRMPIVQKLPPKVSSRDVYVFSFLSQDSFSCCNGKHDTLSTPLFICESGWVVVRLVYPVSFVCLFGNFSRWFHWNL